MQVVRVRTGLVLLREQNRDSVRCAEVLRALRGVCSGRYKQVSSVIMWKTWVHAGKKEAKACADNRGPGKGCEVMKPWEGRGVTNK